MSVADEGSTVRSYMAAFGVAWMTMVALILLTANEAALPVDFTVRPSLVALILAALVALIALPLGRARLPFAAALSAVALLPALWPVPVALLLIELGVWVYRRSTGRSRVTMGRFTVVAVTVIASVSALRLAPQLADYVAEPNGGEATEGRPVYLLLLDGCPRIDSLRQLGIDNTAFVNELETRGFEHYPNATSAHQWTHRTMQAMVAGDPTGIPDEPGSTGEEQAIRASLQLPAGWLAIDPPASHVVMRGGTNVSASGMNDFEIRLVGASLLGKLVRDPAASIVADSLRAHFERSLQLLVESRSDRTFAHVLAPHPPFIYADGISPCWPGCNIFDVSTEKLDISRAEWADQMAVQLEEVNARVLAAVDRILEEHSDAVIVLFSDHGGRIDVESEEVHMSFLVARTPERGELFGAEPHPHAILRLLTEAYP
jgi:hypothetical protein